MAAVLICVILCAGALLARRYGVTPVKSQPQARLFTVIEATGDAAGLEQLFRGMEHLKSSGAIAADAVIAADGLTDEGRRRVELTAERWGAAVCDADDIGEVLRKMCE